MLFRQSKRRLYLFIKALCFLVLNFEGSAIGQCRKPTDLWHELRLVENSKEDNTTGKLVLVLKLKGEFELCRHPLDSVYARMLHRIALYDYLINNNSPTNRSISYTLEAIRINTRITKRGSLKFAVNSYSNLAMYYKDLRLYDKALDYYDSTSLLVAKIPEQFGFLISSRFDRSEIFFHTGNYQQSIDESFAGFLESKKRSDTSWMISFLNQKAQSNYFQSQLPEAIDALDKVIAFATTQIHQYKTIDPGNPNAGTAPDLKQVHFELSTAYKTKALIHEKMGKDTLAELFFNKAIYERLVSVVDNNFGQVAGDYNDMGNFYLNTIGSFRKANACYLKTLEYAKQTQDKARMAKGYLNLGQSSYRQKNHRLAEYYYMKSLDQFGLSFPDFLQQPTSTDLSRIQKNEFTLVYLRNRMELLIALYKKSHDDKYLQKALETAFLNDTLVTRFRHEQTGDQSKLYWRNFTRESYAFAMEAAYLIKDPGKSFFFMEKSRAVLLNDKLNELGSFAYLPSNEAVKEQELRNNILREQHQLISNPNTDRNNEAAQLKLLHAKEELGRYINTLEIKYPGYYQYKYADEVPSLADLKKYLLAKQQSFVHYFIGDSVTYILGISGNHTKMLRIGKEQFQPGQIPELLRMFSDKQMLNTQYSKFVSLSYSLYKNLFEPLHLPTGRVVICPDNFLLPFEALNADIGGRKMLIEDFTFTYIYSARYLVKDFPRYPAKGNFVGFAPVSFSSNLGLADLKNSAISLEDAAANYSQVVMYKSTQATKRNFLSSIGSYHIVNVFSHARADEGDEEPVLFMQDSVIRLSELQYVNNPSTRLVVLSACQTVVGKNETGEGIYSLARGFAAAGIPAVAATIWKADEEAIYAISKVFHQYLANGMTKDEALRKAKLQFIRSADREKVLPYYWANMIIIGNPDAIEITRPFLKIWWIILPAVFAVLFLFVLYNRKEKAINK